MFITAFTRVVILYIAGADTNNAGYRLAGKHQTSLGQANSRTILLHRLEDYLLLAYVPVTVAGTETPAYIQPLSTSYLFFIGFAYFTARIVVGCPRNASCS